MAGAPAAAPLVQQLHGGGQTGQAATYNGNLELGRALRWRRCGGHPVRCGVAATSAAPLRCHARSAAVLLCWRRTGEGGAGSGGNKDGSGASLTPTSLTSSAEADAVVGRSGAATWRTAAMQKTYVGRLNGIQRNSYHPRNIIDDNSAVCGRQQRDARPPHRLIAHLLKQGVRVDSGAVCNA